ncbi:hypothetical protein AAG570_009949 [Ranatra chinensis]|uniref:Sulfotransferase domain-containing protein n=1 Tax=Ranatra chinensis TaxID=642074 RepID=A0ABD0YQL3_9HEMI
MHIKYEKLKDEVAEKLDKLFGVPGCLIEVNPGKVILPPKYQDLGERIYNLNVRPDDVWLVSYPRTGSTWVQEMVWCICNDFKSEASKTISQMRTPLLELTAILANEEGSWKDNFPNSVDQVENMPSPRFIKTHLPWGLLPAQLEQVKPKIIYVARNPKDMCISYYHYCKLIHKLNGSVEEFCELLLDGTAPIGPLWDHILGFWEKRNEPNIQFLKYEDVKKDVRGTIEKMADFLGKSLSEDDIISLMDHVSFKKMRNNPALNLEPLLKLKNGPSFEMNGDSNFIRKGQVGDWKNYMSEDLSQRFDKWMETNLAGTGLHFQTNL